MHLAYFETFPFSTFLIPGFALIALESDVYERGLDTLLILDTARTPFHQDCAFRKRSLYLDDVFFYLMTHPHMVHLLSADRSLFFFHS